MVVVGVVVVVAGVVVGIVVGTVGRQASVAARTANSTISNRGGGEAADELGSRGEHCSNCAGTMPVCLFIGIFVRVTFSICAETVLQKMGTI